MKARIALLLVTACVTFAGQVLAQARHDEKPHGAPAAPAAPPTQMVAPGADEQAIALKDGGTLIIRKDGTAYHANASGRRVRMRDGVSMEAADGTRYMMKNDAIWKQITEKGTLHPNHP